MAQRVDPPSPLARRLRGPRWLDLRLVVGVVLVLGSVLVGAKVISSADSTTGVWAVRGDLAAGTPLQADDLTEVRVRLSDDADRYLATTCSPAGRTLVRDMSAGELLPASAVARTTDFVTFALAVPAERVPVSLRRGQRVAIYASTTDTDAPVQTVQVAAGVTVVDVTGRGDNALTVGSATLQVSLSVPACRVTSIIDATEQRTVSLTVLPSTASVPAVSCPSGSGSASPSAPPTAAPSS